MSNKNERIIQASIRCLELHHHFWQRALAFDGMPKDTRFASFSGNNPFAHLAERAHKVYCSLRTRYSTW